MNTVIIRSYLLKHWQKLTACAVCLLCVALFCSVLINITRNNRLNDEAKLAADPSVKIAYLSPDRSVSPDEYALALEQSWQAGKTYRDRPSYTASRDSEGAPFTYRVPTAFDVGSDGRLYIADALGSRILVYSGNSLEKRLSHPDSFAPAEGDTRELSFSDIAVSNRDSCLWCTSETADEVFCVSLSGGTSPAFSEDSVSNPETVDVLYNGNVLVGYAPGGHVAERRRVFSPELGLIAESTDGSTDFYASDGRIIKLSAGSDLSHDIEVKSMSGDKTLARANFCPDALTDDADVKCTLLGCDSAGKVYFYLKDSPADAAASEYVCTVDPMSASISTIGLQPTDLTMLSPDTEDLIKIDMAGNVYQLQLSEEACRIYKYSF